MKKYQTLAVTCLVTAFFIAACSGGNSGASTRETTETGKIALTLARSSAVLLDSIRVQITGSGMDTVRKKTSGTAMSIELGVLPPGLARRFLVEGFTSGLLTQKGEAVVDLLPGEERSIGINMQAMYGSLVLRVPLGIENPLGVSGGELICTSAGFADTLALTGALPIREFRSGALPMGKEYLLSVKLWNAQKVTLFQGKDTVWIDAESPELALELQSLVSMVSLELKLAISPEWNSSVSMQGSKMRSPRALGDVLILELLPNPKTGGTDWEYTEIWNTTSDTLSLNGCRLAKDGVTTGSTTSANLDGCSVAPGKSLLIARDSLSLSHCSAGGFSLSNSGQSVVVVCAAGLIDSIAYNTPSDTLNPFPWNEGVSLQIPLQNFRSRATGTAWCAGKDSVSLGRGLTILGSPNMDARCQ